MSSIIIILLYYLIIKGRFLRAIVSSSRLLFIHQLSLIITLDLGIWSRYLWFPTFYVILPFLGAWGLLVTHLLYALSLVIYALIFDLSSLMYIYHQSWYRLLDIIFYLVWYGESACPTHSNETWSLISYFCIISFMCPPT